MELNQRESEYLVKYLKEVQGTFQFNEYTWIDPNDKHYKRITAEKAIILNNSIQVDFNFQGDNWDNEYQFTIPLIDFIIFCSQQKEESK